MLYIHCYFRGIFSNFVHHILKRKEKETNEQNFLACPFLYLQSLALPSPIAQLSTKLLNGGFCSGGLLGFNFGLNSAKVIRIASSVLIVLDPC